MAFMNRICWAVKFRKKNLDHGHEPGPLDIWECKGVSEELDNDGFGLLGKDEGDMQFLVLQQVQELRAEVGQLEEKIVKLPQELLGSVS
ncbi:hypothetical protein GBA52_027322 [Prunus armeniaca]|nr:hypothetical protein GBA52_027322 [Prunus armeniaca]